MSFVVLRAGSAATASARCSSLQTKCRIGRGHISNGDGWFITRLSQHPPLHLQQRWGHTVRLIALEDLPHGKAYKGDVVQVKAGYARNFLIPTKKAVYATPQNFNRLGVSDPEVETEEDRLARLERETASLSQEEEQNIKQADR